MADYRVQFEVFEGPLDLLLFLVRKEEVDIYQVNLTKIASEFIEYIEIMRKLDLEVAGEFLVMAATLMYVKSRELLPQDQQAEIEGDEEDEDDPRWDLIRQLVEYKKFKEAAESLQNREREQVDVFARRPEKPDSLPEPAPLQGQLSVFDLIGAVNVVLKRFNERPSNEEIVDDSWTVGDKIALLREKVVQETQFRFTDLFSDAKNRSEVVATFLALLEMIRLKRVVIEQAEAFGEITIAPAPPEPEAPASESSSALDAENSETSFSQ